MKPKKEKKPSSVAIELERLRAKRRGILKPIDVVKAAEPTSSVLHRCFCWDNTVAAHKYRLIQAQTLIRVQVEIIPNTNDLPQRVYVSLDSDKSGYRKMQDVMQDKPLREHLLSQAMAEYQVWYQRWQDLKELAAIFAAAEKVKK